MILLAHSESGQGSGGPFEWWELHPALNHLPIAFLLGGVALDLYAWWRARPGLAQVATGMLIVGLLTGVVTALAGVLAFFTVPGHTEQAHQLMYWHIAIQATALLMFVCPVLERWRNRSATPSLAGRLVGCLAVAFLLVGSAIGGYIVYHGGAGVSPELLAADLKTGHGHHAHHDKKAAEAKNGHKDHKQEYPNSDPSAEEQEVQEYDPQEKHNHQHKHADKAHQQQDPHQSHAAKDKPAPEGKKHDPTKHGDKQDPHTGHAQKAKDIAKSTEALPEVPPASASAAYVPKGHLAQIVLYNLSYPSSLEFDDKGNLYIAEAGRAPGGPQATARIIRVQLAGEIETIVSDGLEAPVTDLLWRDGRLYISHRGKVSTWSEKEKLVDRVTGLPGTGDHSLKQVRLVGRDGRVYFGQGQQLVRIDSASGKGELFFGRNDQRDAYEASIQPGHGDHGKASKDPRHEHGKKGPDHKNHAKPAQEKNEADHKHHPKPEKQPRDKGGHAIAVEDAATPGPRRIVAARFAPGGGVLYVVDFGAIFMTPDGPQAVPGTGVVWRILPADAPAPILLP